MIRTLVTGVSGFTGHYVAERLIARGHDVHGLVYQNGGAEPSGISCHAGALGDLEGLTAILEKVRPDHVVHLAALAFVGHNGAADFYDTNLVGTRNLLQALADSECHPRSVLLASSANIYGNGHEGQLDEATEPRPANDYGVSKLAMEYMARLFFDRFPIIIVRPFNYTGVGQSINFLIPKIVDHIRRRAPLIELGNIDVARDFSDVRTVADAYVRLLDAPKALGGTFNVCSGQAHSLRYILDSIRSLSGHDFDIRVNPAFVRSSEVRTLLGDAARLEAVIGPLGMPDLSETLRWMLEA